jgi:chemotaxis protein methyltransferase CheR
VITVEEFGHFRKLIYDHAGIALAPEKKVMVASRLAKRLAHYGLSTYGQYFKLTTSPEYPNEFQMMVNLLTTNETYFFREPKHFEFLRDEILKPWRGDKFRVWSAASSTGEEAHSLAMVLAETLGLRKWEVFGSDLSTRVLNSARNGVYSMDRLEQMDKMLLKKYCLQGVRSQQGFFRVDEKLRNRVSFDQVNLMKPIPASIGTFDVIFLRNVLIYFDNETKKAVVERLASALKPGGHFFISHSETINRLTDHLISVKSSIFIKNT